MTALKKGFLDRSTMFVYTSLFNGEYGLILSTTEKKAVFYMHVLFAIQVKWYSENLEKQNWHNLACNKIQWNIIQWQTQQYLWGV